MVERQVLEADARGLIEKVINTRRGIEDELRNVGAMLMGVEVHLTTAIHGRGVDDQTLRLVNYWKRQYEEMPGLLGAGSRKLFAASRFRRLAADASLTLRALEGEEVRGLREYLELLSSFLLVLARWVSRTEGEP